MILLIDGYNLLKQIFPGVKNNLDRQKSSFIQQLAYYKTKKSADISEIIVVFDAGPSIHATRTIKSGIVIIYSGVKSSADNWILHFAENNKHKEILVVSMDRALCEACKEFDVDTMDVYEFYKILQSNLLDHVLHQSHEQEHESLEKYDPVDLDELGQSTVDHKALDLLMEQSSIQMYGQKNDERDDAKKDRKGKAITLSKKEKRVLAKLKKLQ